MAADIQNQFGIEAELIRGGGGVFDVNTDGHLLFSKQQAGRFPESQEIIDILASLNVDSNEERI